MKRTTLAPSQLRLVCRFWERESDKTGTHVFSPTPLTLLNRVFGASRSPPWFDDGAHIDKVSEAELVSTLPLQLNHSKFVYRIEVTGDGKNPIKASSLSWGITKYSSLTAKPELKVLFDDQQKKALAELFRENQWSTSKDPFHPLIVRLDKQWIEHFLNPIGINLDTCKNNEVLFFDMWFNTALVDL
jgi:hypothetical protein